MPDPSVERFRRVVEAASGYLEARRNEVNDLNVFPVADGDTGDNMALTMRAVLAELDRIEAEGGEEADRTELVHAVARAALMGARGNSGVILSQIVRGAAEELATRPGELIDPVLVSAAFARAADAAYESVRNPAEGTMLTVVRAMALAAAKHLARLADDSRRIGPGFGQEAQDELLAETLEVITLAGEQAVQRTPGQLEVLADAGVVDAGAHGLVLILAGIVAGLRGEETPQVEIPEQAPARSPPPSTSTPAFSTASTSSSSARAWRPASSSRRCERSATRCWSSATVARSGSTSTPTSRSGRGRSSTAAGRSRRSTRPTCARRWPSARERLAGGVERCAAVAVVSGPGLRSLYEGLGAGVVDGGPTMNPSTDELLAGIHSVDAESVLVFPNSPNVVLAAQHAADLSERDARVIDCTSQQAGLAALVELEPSATIDDNEKRLTEALEGVRVGAVAPAARDDAEGRFVRGDAVGFLDGEVTAWGGAGSTLAATIAALIDPDTEIVTIIEGEGAPIPLEQVATLAPPEIETEVHRGGQPSYWWLLASQ